jgi:hypothetical protein
MKHNLNISLRREPYTEDGIVRCRMVSLRGRLLDRLLGEKQRVAIIIPGDSVECVSIGEVPKEGERDL